MEGHGIERGPMPRQARQSYCLHSAELREIINCEFACWCSGPVSHWKTLPLDHWTILLPSRHCCITLVSMGPEMA